MERLTPRPSNRDGPFGKQWHAGQVLDALIRKGLPKDAYGVMAMTMCDLYPKPEWNFVYGLARLQQRVGVFSFVRHTPSQRARRDYLGAQLLHRALKTLLHEIGHMFGLKHCTWYNCLMRGNNGEGVESQLNYLHLCPVCLRKLHWNIGFDIPTRYARLLDIFQTYEAMHPDFTRDCTFLQQRVKELKNIEPDVTIISDLIPKVRRPLSAQGKPPGPKAQSRSRSSAITQDKLDVAPGTSVGQRAASKSSTVAAGTRRSASVPKAPSKAATPVRPPVDPRSDTTKILAKYPAHAQLSAQIKNGDSNLYAPFPAPKKAFSRNGSRLLSAFPKTSSPGLNGPTCACCATDEDIVCELCE